MADISRSIIPVKFICKLCMQNNTTASWIMKGGNFQTSKKCKTTFILKEFHENKSIKWNLHVDSTPSPHCYDMILGCNIMSKLGIMLHFKDQTMTWDDLTIRIKDPESFLDLLDPVNDFFWSNDHYKTEALQEASTHLQKIWNAKYAPEDLNKVIWTCRHITNDEKTSTACTVECIWSSIWWHLRDMAKVTLQYWTLKRAKPYHSKPFPVPKIHECTLKVKFRQTCQIGSVKANQ